MSTTAAPSYTWVDNWATIPACDNGRTHGVCVTKQGTVMVFHQADNGLLTFDPDGKLMSAVGGDRWNGAHGLTLIEENGEEYLWLTDQNTGEVVKVSLDGETVLSLAKPDEAIFEEKGYSPTWAAQNPDTKEIWMGDGYGSGGVYRYTADGSYQGCITGREGAGKFNCPHGINFQTGANGEQELWITDRANSRIQIYDGNGTFLRQSGSCHSPCCFDFHDGKVVVPELFTGVKILDQATLEVITEVGASDRVGPCEEEGKWWPPKQPEGWPNVAGTEHIRAGFFNSPHGACFAPNGDIYVVEWIVGGRITKLTKND